MSAACGRDQADLLERDDVRGLARRGRCHLSRRDEVRHGAEPVDDMGSEYSGAGARRRTVSSRAGSWRSRPGMCIRWCLWPPAALRESHPLTPLGEYANAAVARERMFEFFSRSNGTPIALIRLNYAVELRYGVLVDIARKVWAGEPSTSRTATSTASGRQTRTR